MITRGRDGGAFGAREVCERRMASRVGARCAGRGERAL